MRGHVGQRGTRINQRLGFRQPISRGAKGVRTEQGRCTNGRGQVSRVEFGAGVGERYSGCISDNHLIPLSDGQQALRTLPELGR